ncbi:MAG: hypothetical protein Fur0012_01210 [Elusimicrobiota bacterium]
MRDALIICFSKKGIIEEPFFCLLQEANKLAASSGGKVSALVFSIDESIPPEITRHGLEKIYFCSDKRIYDNNFTSGIIAQVLSYFNKPFVLFPADDLSKALAARLAAKLGCGLIADAIEISLNGDLMALKPAMGGNIKAEIFSRSEIKLITFKTYKVSSNTEISDQSPIEIVKPKDNICALTELIREEAAAGNKKNLEEAKIVIGVGHKVKKEDISLVRELSSITGASIGYTRPAVHEGLGDHEEQIGVTGKTIYPEIYIAVAVSGKSYHMNGIKGNPLIISINSDENAQIKEFSDYFIKSDYKTALTEILQELKK